jgi:acetyl-CoA carboxylase biotin carboxylase subunit
MGDKSEARKTMIAAGVPVLPGSDGPLRDAEHAVSSARSVGYPIIIKASAGGGGRGMRIVWEESELLRNYELAKSEAAVSFANDEVYLEKFLTSPKHIEFQILGDQYGHVIHLGERECSIQRRHQKVIEEAPSFALSSELREKMGKAAVAAAKSTKYHGAGTVEFLMDDDQNFFFMEMNTRIQVEHGISELITGVDLVKWQIRIAAGVPLKMKQKDICFKGHAIECRINAEDPATFRPSPGTIQYFHLPGGPGIRVDSAAYAGYVVPPHYDSMVAKIMAFGNDRNEAIARMSRALDLTVIEGIQTNRKLHQQILNTESFQKGDYNTKFMEDFEYREL